MLFIIGRHTGERERNAELASGPAIRFSLPRVYCRRSPYGRSPIPFARFRAQIQSLYVEARFLSENNTLEYYRAGIKNPTGFGRLAKCTFRESGQRPLGRFRSAIGQRD